MQIRRAEPEDAVAIAQVHVASWRHAYRDFLEADYLAALSVEKRAQMWAASIAAGTPEVLVAGAEGAVSGFIAFGPSRDPDAVPDRAEIWTLYLDPACWSRGMGRALWLAARERMRERGAASVTLWVAEPNARAIRFYLAAGFAPDPGARKEISVGSVRLQEVRYSKAIER